MMEFPHGGITGDRADDVFIAHEYFEGPNSPPTLRTGCGSWPCASRYVPLRRGGHDVFVSSLRQHGLYCPERATRVPGPNNNLGDTPPSKSKAKCAPDMEREVIETGLPGLRSCSAPILPDIGQRGRSGVPIPDYNRSAHLAELHGGDLPTDALDVSDYDHSAQPGGGMGDLLDNALSVIVLKVARSIRRERFAIPLQLAFKNP